MGSDGANDCSNSCLSTDLLLAQKGERLESHPGATGNGVTDVADPDQKRENCLSASNGGTVRWKFPRTKEIILKENIFIDETFNCQKVPHIS